MTITAEHERLGQKKRDRDARRMRDIGASVSDIGDIPKVVNRRRRNACRLDLHKFLTTYFPNTTGLSPFSADHDRVIERIRSCILEGGRYVNAVYRGFAKTTISENAAIWAILYGHRRFVVLFGADAKAAAENMESIQLELEGNDLLYDDFPEVCHAVRHLEGKPQRAGAQRYRDKLTHIEWTAERVVLPRIPKSVASGAVIVTRGITAGFRGLKKKLADGSQPRPDLIIPDDPQTDDTASTPLQVHKTLALFRKGITKLGTHQVPPAIVVNATVIQQDDAIDHLLNDTAWQGERIPLVRKWPDAHKTLWLEEYRAIRETYSKDIPGDQSRAHRQATEFYRSRREEMDAGSEVSWDNCRVPGKEISSLQHAYNALIDDGEEAFASEYQVRPLARVKPQPGDLVPEELCARLNRCPRGTVPAGSTRLTAFVDVQGDFLPWAVVSWTEAFGGHVVDYGSWPDQRRAYYTVADARPTLAQATGIATLEGSLYAGLKALSAELLGREWLLQGGGSLKIDRCLVDAGWGLSTELVHRFCRQSGYAQLLPSKGVGVSAAMVPMSDWPKKPGERRGDSWVIRPPASGYGQLALFDANRWKSFVASRLKQPVGESGAVLVFGDDSAVHKMFADHCCSEHRIETTGRGRTVQEWKLKPHRPDNHLWDAVVGAAVAASILGLEPSGMPKDTRSGRKGMSFRQAAERHRNGR